MRKRTSSDYFRLFVRREGKVVLGRRLSNLWLLTSVLTLTFFAIAFSNASLKYLSYKMNDPFINWVDIVYNAESDTEPFLSSLNYSDVKDQFHISGYQVDNTGYFMFCGAQDNVVKYPFLRFFGSFEDNVLLKAILAEDNVVDNCAADPSVLNNHSLGVVISKEMLLKLGYENNPSFIDIQRYSAGADTLGFKLDGEYGRIPVPVIAVVKKLPSNADMIATRFFLEQQYNDETYPFNLNHREYATSLHYFVPSTVSRDDFMSYVNEVGADTCYVRESYLDYFQTFADGSYVSVSSKFPPELNLGDAETINDAVTDRYDGQGVVRVYDMKCPEHSIGVGTHISIQFKDLNKIHEFEEYASQDKYKVRIEMAQILAKENFNSVSVMANVLSWAIILFSILCIILFIVNLLKSYFQKVKRNLGTFKAFGISNWELIRVYVLILFFTVLGAVVLSMAVVAAVQYILPMYGILKDGMFNYLSLWNTKTYYAILIILVCSIVTVYSVMRRLLSATPGDLIYDRQ